MLGLKCSIERSYFRDVYGFDVVECFAREIELLNSLNLIDVGQEMVRLTKSGTLFADEIGQLVLLAAHSGANGSNQESQSYRPL